MYLQASFSDLILADHYDSDETDVLQNFYKPVVSRAVRYDRAVGYFSVKALISIAKELSTFVKNDGKIRLVVGCFIDPSELDGLTSEQIEFTERKRVRELLISTLDQLEQESTNASSLLSKLVVADVLEIKLALRKAGIYHEKFGIFCDAEGRKVAFHGGQLTRPMRRLIQTLIMNRSMYSYRPISIFIKDLVRLLSKNLNSTGLERLTIQKFIALTK
jgi:hypothetical protein